MAKISGPTIFLFFFIIFILIIGSPYIVQAFSGAQHRDSIAEFLAGEEEWELDSEVSRRILATTKYISCGAFQKNTVPCSKRGASYCNCQNGAQANPYARGCNAITSCRS